MMSGWNGLDTFDAVAAFYNRIKPVRTQIASDIRPVGDRKAKHVRIVKVSECEYYITMVAAPKDKHTHEDDCLEYSRASVTAPIRWVKHPTTGIETVTVRNNPAGSVSVSHYRMLAELLPRALKFDYTRDGKHWVSCNGESFFLPKFKITFDPNSYMFCKSWGKECLQFERDPVFDSWRRSGAVMPRITDRLDQNMKVVFDPLIESFWDWFVAIIPAMGYIDTVDARHYLHKITLDMEGAKNSIWKVLPTELKPETVRAILQDPEHPHRTGLAVSTAYALDLYKVHSHLKPHNHHNLRPMIRTPYVAIPETETEAKALRRKFISLMRKAASLYAVEYK